MKAEHFVLVSVKTTGTLLQDWMHPALGCTLDHSTETPDLAVCGAGLQTV